jgi:glycosyltransferase involved in cell wall biosynthesis
MDLGLYATKLRQNNPFAFVLTEFAVLIAHYTDAQRDSSKPFSSPVNNQQHEQQVTVNTKKIAIYCNEYGQSWWPGWGPRSFDKNKTNANRGGVGGSEEAVYFISIELAKLGYQVDVYGDVDKDQDGLMVYSSTVQENSFVRRRGFVCWKQMSTFDPFSCLSDVNINNCYDAFIAWRYSISLVLGIHSAKTRFLWLHDLLTSESLPPLDLIFSDVPESSSSQDNRNLLHLWCHGIWVQSKFHQDFIRNEYSKLSQSRNSRVLIVPNGIPDEEIAMLQKNPKHHDVNRNDIFIYGSAPNRGLQEVLELWHNIRNYRPSATLHIFYGFTPKATEAIRKQFGESSEDQKRFEVWMQYMQKLLQKDGVVYHGHVDHATLMNAYAHAGFLLYPTSFPETGCITMIRAMIAGAIPISSKFTNSVLATLGGEFDLGPSGEDALNLTIATNYQSKLDWLVKKYVPRVFDVLDLPIDMLNDLRNRMTLRMREKYSWGESAKVADNIFDTTHRYFLD